MSHDKTILKIKKLLSLAKSNNPNEAALALSRAQKLMQQHSIDQTAINLSDCETRMFSFTKENINDYEGMLLNTIKMAFGVDFVCGWHWNGGKRVQNVEMIGIAPQPELANYCLDVVYRQIVKARADYVATLSNRSKRLTKIRKGDEFAKGWVTQVAHSVRRFALSDKQTTLIEEYRASKFDKLETSKGRETLKLHGSTA